MGQSISHWVSLICAEFNMHEEEASIRVWKYLSKYLDNHLRGANVICQKRNIDSKILTEYIMDYDEYLLIVPCKHIYEIMICDTGVGCHWVHSVGYFGSVGSPVLEGAAIFFYFTIKSLQRTYCEYCHKVTSHKFSI